MKKIIFNLLNFPQILKILLSKKDNKKRWDPTNDLDLEMYSKIFNFQSLHYGFFKNIPKDPRAISLKDIELAMNNYSNFIINKLSSSKKIVDIGCGNGVILKKLFKQKKMAWGLTPNLIQYNYIKKKEPQLKVINSTFEDWNPKDFLDNSQKIDTLLMAESFQYLNLEKTFSQMNFFFKLYPKSNWIIFDYFRIKEKCQNNSGHFLKETKKMIKKNNFQATQEIDYTRNILPTLEFVHSLTNTFTEPLASHFLKNLKHTNPLIHYFFKDHLDERIKKINLDIINPNIFKKEKNISFLKSKNLKIFIN